MMTIPNSTMFLVMPIVRFLTALRSQRIERLSFGLTCETTPICLCKLLMPNNAINQTVQQDRCYVPSALCAPAAGFIKRKT